MKRIFLCFSACLALFSTPGYAIDGVYVGGSIGHVGLSGRTAASFSPTIGFGIDLGLKASPVMDITGAFQASSHSGGAGMNLLTFMLTADYKFAEANDFEFWLTGGPGFYFFKTVATTDTKFGINLGTTGNVVIDENIKLGLNFRYHFIFNTAAGVAGDSYWTVMLRFGYVFNTGGA